MVQRAGTVLLGFLSLQVATAAIAQADPIAFVDGTSPFRLLASGGDVTAHFVGSDAGYDSLLYLWRAGEEPLSLFENHAAAVGDRVNLGAHDAGTELVFGLHVLNTGHHFFAGSGARNPDGEVHARAIGWGATSAIPTPGVLIGFEDLLGGGDRDFNDLIFLVSNVTLADPAAVPEPATLLLVGSGVAGFAALRRRRRA
jgi:hypothetical protein